MPSSHKHRTCFSKRRHFGEERPVPGQVATSTGHIFRKGVIFEKMTRQRQYEDKKDSNGNFTAHFRWQTDLQRLPDWACAITGKDNTCAQDPMRMHQCARCLQTGHRVSVMNPTQCGSKCRKDQSTRESSGKAKEKEGSIQSNLDIEQSMWRGRGPCHPRIASAWPFTSTTHIPSSSRTIF